MTGYLLALALYLLGGFVLVTIAIQEENQPPPRRVLVLVGEAAIWPALIVIVMVAVVFDWIRKHWPKGGVWG